MKNSPILISFAFVSALCALGGCDDPDALTGEPVGIDDLELQDEQHVEVVLDGLEIQDDNQHADAQGPALLKAPSPDPLESGWAYSFSTPSGGACGGTWGCILKLTAFVPAKIYTHNAHFRIAKTDGSKFTTTGTVSLRRTSSGGPVVLSAPIYAGAYYQDFKFDFDAQSNFGSKPVGSYIDYWGRVESNSGVAYHGMIRVTKGTYP